MRGERGLGKCKGKIGRDEGESTGRGGELRAGSGKAQIYWARQFRQPTESRDCRNCSNIRRQYASISLLVSGVGII